MIQPFKSYLYLDCGKSYLDFDEKLLEEFDKLSFMIFKDHIGNLL